MKYSWFVVEDYDGDVSRPCIFHVTQTQTPTGQWFGEWFFSDGIPDGEDWFWPQQFEEVPRFYRFREAARFCYEVEEEAERRAEALMAELDS